MHAQRYDNVILLHDTTRPHVAKPGKTYLETLQWEVLPIYSVSYYFSLYQLDVTSFYLVLAIINSSNTCFYNSYWIKFMYKLKFFYFFFNINLVIYFNNVLPIVLTVLEYSQSKTLTTWCVCYLSIMLTKPYFELTIFFFHKISSSSSNTKTAKVAKL